MGRIRIIQERHWLCLSLFKEIKPEGVCLILFLEGFGGFSIMKNISDIYKQYLYPYRGIIYVVLFLWVGAVSQLIVNHFFVSDQRVMEAFSSTSSNPEKSKLEIIADYGTDFLSEEDKKQLIQYIAEELGLSDPYTTESIKNGSNYITTAYKKSKNAETVIEIITTKEARQYIIVNLSLYDRSNNILKYKKRLEKSLKKIGVKELESVVTLTGSYEGKLSEKEMKNEIDRILKRLQAKVVSESKIDGLTTIYAYTGLVDEYIMVLEQPMNINIVVSYEDNQDQTILYLATPVLNEDY